MSTVSVAKPNPCTAAAPVALQEEEWQARRTAHQQRVSHWTAPHAARRARGEKHPIHDFLFDYYHFTPGQLTRWHPGFGAILSGPGAAEYLDYPGYRATAGGVTCDPGWLKPNRREAVQWILTLLKATRDRAPFYGCFGLHEWAMVYREPEVRHAQWPMRFDAPTIAAIVESHPVRCSHFDAFRFFTPAARPLNRLEPQRSTIHALEQRGCLHANMDLYKWSFKLTPLIPSEWIADAFALALEIRETDMRASPYDFRPLGFEPIAIETSEGRLEYERRQRAFSERGVALRERLIVLYEAIVATFSRPF